MYLAPSILSADFSQLAEQVEKIKDGDLIHVDVMDGHFVPNISFGATVMKSLNGKTKLPYDVHLMIENPDFFIQDFVTPQTEYITVHSEACIHLDRTISLIRKSGIKVGVALNPATPLNSIEEILPGLDLVLMMSVNPGFGGQSFIEYSLDKIKRLNEIRIKRGLEFLIEVDGGINLNNAKNVLMAGADILVAGSAVFGSDGIEETVRKFKEL